MEASPKSSPPFPSCGLNLKEEVAWYERELIRAALVASGGQVTKAARLLGMPKHQTLSSKIITNYPELFEVRKPAKPRHKTLVKNWEGVRRGGKTVKT